MTNHIQISNISVRLSNRNLLQSITAAVPNQQLTMLMGANGAGKSTLLSALCGEIEIESGANNGFWVNGHNYLNLSAAQQAESRAFLRQHHSLSLDFYVEEVIRLALSRDRTREVQQYIIHEMASLTEIKHLLHRTYTTLSGGEQARVHLARVFAQLWCEQPTTTRLLLLDEPVASLDPYHQHHVCQMVLQFIKSQNISVIMTMHDLHLAARYADHILLLHNGQLIAHGTPSVVLTPKHLYSAFHVHTKIDLDAAQRPIIHPHQIEI